MALRGLVVAAPASGAGKTTVTLALLRALSARGHGVAGAKSGPDYIDPRFHEAACGAPSVNLDAWAMSPETLRARAAAVPAETLVVEAAMGVLDGAGRAARGSAADLAEALGLPVLLVIDAAKAGASAALPAAGLAAMRPSLRIAGVILNRTGSPRHAAMAAAPFAELGLPVLGTLPRAAELSMAERHLGLVQAEEHAALDTLLDTAAARLSENTDLDAILGATAPLAPGPEGPDRLPPPGQRVAIAADTAFAFTYPHLLDDWRASGAEIRPFSPLADEPPWPEADAVLLPGGYPELHAGRLAAATGFREGMEAARARGASIHGECGGYMVLGEALHDAGGTAHRMLGFLPVETSFATRRLTLGYRHLSPLAGPWSGPLAGHEFHYATITREAPGPRLFAATDAEGTALPDAGHAVESVTGAFAHIIGPAPR